MALLFPWATKEYLLWEMSLGQLVMYHNIGLEIKYPKPPAGDKPSYKDMSTADLRKARDEARALLGKTDSPRSKEEDAMYRAKYGAI